MKRLDPFVLPLAVATAALFWIVPGFPLAHLDDPNHWGVVGFALLLALVLRLRLRGVRGSRSERRLLAISVAAMPVVYVADWLRFGGALAWLWIELLAMAGFWILAVLAVKRSPWFLVAGLAAHGLWDAAHAGRTEFVADWYALGCLVVDTALAIYAAGQVRFWLRREPGSSRFHRS